MVAPSYLVCEQICISDRQYDLNSSVGIISCTRFREHLLNVTPCITATTVLLLFKDMGLSWIHTTYTIQDKDLCDFTSYEADYFMIFHVLFHNDVSLCLKQILTLTVEEQQYYVISIKNISNACYYI